MTLTTTVATYLCEVPGETWGLHFLVIFLELHSSTDAGNVLVRFSM